MPLTAGTRLGEYEILAPIGAGGMGEVYRARDAKLNRDVALKVLPGLVASDPDRLARFRREAQVLASLNHPHIAQIYEMTSGVASGGAHTETASRVVTLALVMELVEGPTLADRIALGPMAWSEAQPIARQIADALEAAHEQGIVHRDLKPANIKVRGDGTVKVLDFGLAKAMDPAAASNADVMNSPTLTARATQLGIILGTAAYMAPEQAKGKSVDKRADIWAFGVVLFEMLSGRRAFNGEDISEVIAAVLRQEIDWGALPKETPRKVRRLLEQCLERDPKRRLRDIGDAWLDFNVPEEHPLTPDPIRQPTWISRALPWGAAAVVALGTVAWSLLHASPPQPRVVTRAAVALKGFSAFVNVSRDGTRMAYTSVGGPSSAFLTLRMMDQFEGKPIPGSDGAGYPLFSPDGQWLAYATLDQPSKIKKIPVTGGTSITLCDGAFVSGSAWGDDDTIVFSGAKGLMRVSASGGTPQTLTTVDPAKKEASHVRPQFLPGGRQLLFTITQTNTTDSPQFAVLDLGKGTYRTVAKGGVNGRYVASGHLTYVRGATLFVLPFDLQRLAVTGTEVPVVEGVSTLGPDGTGDYSVTDAGLLAYFASDSTTQGTMLAWANRKGATELLPGQSRQLWGTGRLSPDGRRVASGIRSEKNGTADIWILDVQRGTPTRVTFDGGDDLPVWTPDGTRVVYASRHGDKSGLYSVAADGSGKAVLLLETDKSAAPSSFTPDGKTLVYDQVSAEKRRQILVLPLQADGRSGPPHPLHEADAPEANAQVSPDGKWVAYQSAESSNWEIYVQPFPGPGGKVRISAQGGTAPRWARSGRELFYWGNSPTSRLMTVEIPPDSALRPGAPQELFQLLSGTTWDVSPDRDRFLVELTSSGNGATIATVTDWFEELARRAPAKK
jgi:serine/threonine protein kinase/Tol biopolymer transport system component